LNGLVTLAVAGEGQSRAARIRRVVRRPEAPRFDGCRVDVGAPASRNADAIDFDAMLNP
jgi:hypothetical protein